MKEAVAILRGHRETKFFWQKLGIQFSVLDLFPIKLISGKSAN